MANRTRRKRKNNAGPKDLQLVSLFSGAMGLDLGLERAGFETRLALEINNDAVRTIRANRPTLPVITDRIEDVRPGDILREANMRRGEACVLTGGPCCQAFSTVGKRESLADSRGGLFRHFTRMVAGMQPRFFVMENVKGILSAAVKHRPLKQRGPGYPPLSPDEELGSALRVICRELSELNYYVVFGLLNCADYGTPQTRLRVVFIGSRDGENIALPKPTHSEVAANGERPWITLRDCIGDCREKEPQHNEFRPIQKEFLARLKAGENWRDLPTEGQRRALGGAFDSWGGRCGFFRRLSWDKPAPTLTTDPTGTATTLCHPTLLRPLSIGEYKKLQQFPHSWSLEGSITQKYIQLGNAVPLGLGEAIGRMLRKVIMTTCRQGLAKEAKRRKGTVVCADPALAKRLLKRPRTKLEPSRYRLNPDPEAAKRWLAAVAVTH